MKNSTRREFLEKTGALIVFGLMFAGCKTMGTLGQNMGNILEGTVGQSGGGNVGLALKSAKAIGRNFTDFTPEQEYYIGRTVGAQLLGKYPPFDNSPANNYANILGQTLAQASNLPETFGGYHFLIQDSDEINAFAAPGGFIFITKGMIRCCDSEDAFAAVLAHEIGHIQFRHGIQSIKKSRIADTFATIGVESAKQFGAKGLGRLVDLFEESIIDITKTLVTDGYSRSFENEADQAAVDIMKRVGYDPACLMDMLHKMEHNLIPGRNDFSQTHPEPKIRIETIQTLVGHISRPGQPESRINRFQQFSKMI
ncbi:MAG: hypothetical protein A2277_07075 [Desulfobacterales bacterium RIFOXYA12_FULL_46_15]|nr:MAG: hypothetical protein A2097_15560 [Desulfobacula sp. GWF2_41_7]OGR27957.1 MAG: hypothetical protein A2277_07075 [Desulfobacterales bacterium RIFOXYA12_FULL_46_15]